MTKIFLVDDEPLVLIGMQGMLNWAELGYTVVGTARIAAAKELMAATDLKIYEVSSRVGFDSAFYFSKVFKKLEGASPREYIQRMKGSYVDAKDDAAL